MTSRTPGAGGLFFKQPEVQTLAVLPSPPEVFKAQR